MEKINREREGERKRENTTQAKQFDKTNISFLKHVALRISFPKESLFSLALPNGNGL